MWPSYNIFSCSQKNEKINELSLLLKKVGSIFISYSNHFQHLASKSYKAILYLKSQTIFKSSQPLLYFLSLLHLHTFFLLYICIVNPILLRRILPPIDRPIGYRHINICAIGSILPSVEILGVQMRSCGRGFFQSCQKKSRLELGFGNSWRCSYNQQNIHPFGLATMASEMNTA
jgi:hypothetical protein